MYYRGHSKFHSLEADFIQGLPQHVVGKQWYVSGMFGNDDNPGTKSRPLATIGAARTKNTADYAAVNWASQKRINIIWVEPGEYAENLGGFYFCHVIGLGIRGTDTQAEIHPATGSCIAASTMLGASFLNLWFEVNEQNKPIIDIGILNSSQFRSCTFALGANVTGVVGIDTENSTHLWVEDCDFESGQLQNMAYCLYHRGGGDKFLHQARILNNRMWGKTGGIYIAGNCTASGALIKKNFIHIDTTGIGIDGNPGGADTGCVAFVVDNDIVVDGAGDAIHGFAAGQKLYNKTIVNGAFAYETALA